MALTIRHGCCSLLRIFACQLRVCPSFRKFNSFPILMSHKYKLTYFNGTGRPEPLKFMFAFKNIKYEDIRIKMSDWEKVKPTTPHGQLPVLEIDGKVLAESYSMMRFVAKQLGFLGKTDLEAAKADEIMDYIKPLYDHQTRLSIFFCDDQEKKKQLQEKFCAEIVPPYFKKLDEILSQNGDEYIVGKGLTWADFGVAYFMDEIERNDCDRPIINKYPSLGKHRLKIFDLPGVKEHIETRPKGDF